MIKSVENRETGSDFAIIRLRRPVLDRSPLQYRQSGTVPSNQELIVIGHPSGLPTKVSDEAEVSGNEMPAFFLSNLDAFGGNSGSPVLDAETGIVEGVLVRGEYDYVRQNGCKRPKFCANDMTGCSGEGATRITEVLPFL